MNTIAREIERIAGILTSAAQYSIVKKMVYSRMGLFDLIIKFDYRFSRVSVGELAKDEGKLKSLLYREASILDKFAKKNCERVESLDPNELRIRVSGGANGMEMYGTLRLNIKKDRSVEESKGEFDIAKVEEKAASMGYKTIG